MSSTPLGHEWTERQAKLLQGWTIGTTRRGRLVGKPADLVELADTRIKAVLDGRNPESWMPLLVGGVPIGMSLIGDALLTGLPGSDPELCYTGYIEAGGRFHLLEFRLADPPYLEGSLKYIRSSPAEGTAYHLGSIIGYREGTLVASAG